MNKALVLGLAALLAAPAVSIPTPSEAQVLTGRGSAPRAPRVSAEQRRENRLMEAEDRVFELDERIAELRAKGEAAGGLTAAQQRQLDQLTARRNDAQRTVDRLNADT